MRCAVQVFQQEHVAGQRWCSAGACSGNAASVVAGFFCAPELAFLFLEVIFLCLPVSCMFDAVVTLATSENVKDSCKSVYKFERA